MGFSEERFKSLCEGLAHGLVPASHALVFHYTSLHGAKACLRAGLPAHAAPRGVVVTFRRPPDLTAADVRAFSAAASFPPHEKSLRVRPDPPPAPLSRTAPTLSPSNPPPYPSLGNSTTLSGPPPYSLFLPLSLVLLDPTLFSVYLFCTPPLPPTEAPPPVQVLGGGLQPHARVAWFLTRPSLGPTAQHPPNDDPRLTAAAATPAAAAFSPPQLRPFEACLALSLPKALLHPAPGFEGDPCLRLVPAHLVAALHPSVFAAVVDHEPWVDGWLILPPKVGAAPPAQKLRKAAQSCVCPPESSKKK